MPDKKVATTSDVYEIFLGTFNDNKFTWYSISKHKDLVDAYKAYKKYVNTQLKYTDEELKKVWDTGRLDVELRQGNKLLNWTGIYSRKVTELTRAEEEEAEEGKKKSKDKKKDSASDIIALKEGAIDSFGIPYNGKLFTFFKTDKGFGYGIKQSIDADQEILVDDLSVDELVGVYQDLIKSIEKKSK